MSSALDLDHRVRGRRAEVEDEIRLVEQAARRHVVDVARDIDCAIDVTAMTRSARAGAPRAISTGTAVEPPAEKTIITSLGPKVKFERITSARPGVRSMNIAWRWPFAPTTWVWKVIDSSTIGLKPGVRAVAGEHLLDRDPRVAGAEEVDEAVGRDRVGATTGWRSRSRRPGSWRSLEEGPAAVVNRGTSRALRVESVSIYLV